MADYSSAALDAGEQAHPVSGKCRHDAEAILTAASNPALGLDGSICKRAVIERIQREADEYDDERDQILVRRVAETLVREWHRVR